MKKMATKYKSFLCAPSDHEAIRLARARIEKELNFKFAGYSKFFKFLIAQYQNTNETQKMVSYFKKIKEWMDY